MSDSPKPGMVPIEDGAAPPDFPGGGPAPEGAESARPYPGGMMKVEAPKVKGWPYVRRALKMLGNHKGIVTATMLLTLASNLAPFVIAAAFGPLVQILGEAAQGNRMGNVWGMTGSLYSKANPSTTGFEGWLATPLSFTTIFVIWAGATIGVVLLRLVNTWMMAIFEQDLHAEVQERVYNHLQNLSLDFFTGGKTGALMQRILHETQNVQRVLTQVLLPPLVQAIALAIALLYMIGLSWQMTLISFAIAPVAFFLFRYALKKLERAAN